MTPYPLRQVRRTSDTYSKYCRAGEGSRWHYLECGHAIVTKMSAGYPARKRCRDCAFNRPPDPQPND